MGLNDSQKILKKRKYQFIILLNWHSPLTAKLREYSHVVDLRVSLHGANGHYI